MTSRTLTALAAVALFLVTGILVLQPEGTATPVRLVLTIALVFALATLAAAAALWSTDRERRRP